MGSLQSQQQVRCKVNDFVKVKTNRAHEDYGIVRYVSVNSKSYGIELVVPIACGSYGIFVERDAIRSCLSSSSFGPVGASCLRGWNNRNAKIKELQNKCKDQENTLKKVYQILSTYLRNNNGNQQYNALHQIQYMQAAINQYPHSKLKNTIQQSDNGQEDHVMNDNDIKINMEVDDEDTLQQIIDLKDKLNAANDSISDLLKSNRHLAMENSYLIMKNDHSAQTIKNQNVTIDDQCKKLKRAEKLSTQKGRQLATYKKYKVQKEKLETENQKLSSSLQQKQKCSGWSWYNNEENKEILKETKLGTAGLGNLGNTCWMNSILQCTSHLPALIEYFNENKMNGNVSTAFQKIITDIWRNDSSSMSNSLRIFKSKMSSVSSKYGSYNEQDPAEFLDYLINVLHDELNIADDEYANNDVIVGNGLPDNMLAKLSWTAYLKKHNSPIIELFYGQHKSNIICANKQCKYDYVIFEPFKMLAVATKLNKHWYQYYTKEPKLYDCIDQYTQTNVLDKSKWHCSKCKHDLPNAIERVQLYKFPKILVIHLKKLQMQSVSAQPFIHYPVNGLNLKQYDISDSKQEYIYDLFAVSCLSGHHCIAYAKNHINKQWFRFSDSCVSKVEEKDVVVRNAYLLFYQRRN